MEKVTGSSPVRSTTRLRFAQQNYGEVPRHSPEGDGGHFWGLHHLPKTRVFYYVYILESAGLEPRFYVGLTDDLKARLRKHNKGAVPHTAKFRPWRLKTAMAFASRERAAFERYTNRPMKILCHCEERSDEAIQLDRHGALRAPRDDNRVKGNGDWYYLKSSSGRAFAKKRL